MVEREILCIHINRHSFKTIWSLHKKTSWQWKVNSVEVSQHLKQIKNSHFLQRGSLDVKTTIGKCVGTFLLTQMHL
jgi:hypothetical protein